MFLSTVSLSLSLHEDTTVYIENYKYTQGKKSEYILTICRPKKLLREDGKGRPTESSLKNTEL